MTVAWLDWLVVGLLVCGCGLVVRWIADAVREGRRLERLTEHLKER